jgi:hypothetical protein
VERLTAMIEARKDDLREKKRLKRMRRPKTLFRRAWNFIGSFLPAGGARPVVPHHTPSNKN